jgi:endoglucanase
MNRSRTRAAYAALAITAAVAATAAAVSAASENNGRSPGAQQRAAAITTAPPATTSIARPSAGAAGAGVPSPDGNWSTQGATIVDGDGDAVQIRGVNWFGFETSAAMPHGLWTRNMEQMIDQIAELGFNTIRLPFSSALLNDGVTPQGLNQQENPDLVGLTSLEVMDRFIDHAGAKGLAVILDRHALGADDRNKLWYDDQFPKERLISDWQVLAKRYADRTNVIGADLYNEPHDEACWGCGDPAVDWKTAAEAAGNALHEIEPQWLIFVEGVEEADGASCDGGASGCTWWGGNVERADEQPVTLAEPNKVVYSPHEYAASVFRQKWFDDPSFPANMAGIWDQFWGGLERSNTAPVMVGEFGTKLQDETDKVWLKELLTYLDTIDAGFTFWSFNPNSGDTGGTLNDDWTTVNTEKMSYLQPYLLGPFGASAAATAGPAGPAETAPPTSESCQP